MTGIFSGSESGASTHAPSITSLRSSGPAFKSGVIGGGRIAHSRDDADRSMTPYPHDVLVLVAACDPSRC